MSDSLLYPAILKTDMQHTINHFDLWTDTHHGVECIDLRREFYDFLHGSETELPKGHQGIFRRMRRDTTGKLIPCLCLDRITREPDKDSHCNYCGGAGYLWDEQWVTYYRQIIGITTSLANRQKYYEPGTASALLAFFFLEYNVMPTLKDFMIELKRDAEDTIILPYKREAMFTLNTVEAFKSDNGRIEYWRVAVNYDPVKTRWE